MAFKQTHNDRCRDIIWKICNHFDRAASIFLFCQLCNIHFQDIFIDHRYIVIIAQRILQDRDQTFINLHRIYLSGCICQILCHRSHTRSDLQNKIILCDLRRTDNFIQHMRIDQKVLSKLFLKCKAVFVQHSNGCLGIAKIRLSLTHSSSFPVVFQNV